MLDTTRRVATPEGIELTLRLAGPVPRALAWMIDFLLRAALVLVVSMLAAYFGRAGWGLVLIAAFFVEWLLPALFEARWGGQTPGKRLLGNRALKRRGDLAAGTVLLSQSPASYLVPRIAEPAPVPPPVSLDPEEQ